jgi:hypothetical protein
VAEPKAYNIAEVRKDTIGDIGKRQSIDPKHKSKYKKHYKTKE